MKKNEEKWEKNEKTILKLKGKIKKKKMYFFLYGKKVQETRLRMRAPELLRNFRLRMWTRSLLVAQPPQIWLCNHI